MLQRRVALRAAMMRDVAPCAGPSRWSRRTAWRCGAPEASSSNSYFQVGYRIYRSRIEAGEEAVEIFRVGEARSMM